MPQYLKVMEILYQHVPRLVGDDPYPKISIISPCAPHVGGIPLEEVLILLKFWCPPLSRGFSRYKYYSCSASSALGVNLVRFFDRAFCIIAFKIIRLRILVATYVIPLLLLLVKV